MRGSLSASLFASLLSLVHSQAPPSVTPPYPTTGAAPASSIGTGTSSPSSSNGVMPLPSLATVITGTIGSQIVTETFVPHIFPQYATITDTITTTTTLVPGSDVVTVVVGPLGVGWAPYHEPRGALELTPPSVLPPTAAAIADDASDGGLTTAGPSGASASSGASVSSSGAAPSGISISTSQSILPSTFQNSSTFGASSSTIPLGTGISASSNISPGTGIGASSSSRSLGTGIGASSSSRPLGTGISTSSSSRPLGTGIGASSSTISPGTGIGASSSSRPLGTGIGASLSTLPLGTGFGASSSIVPLGTGIGASSSRIPLGTGIGASSSSRPLGTGISASSSSIPLGTGIGASSSRVSLGTGFSGPSLTPASSTRIPSTTGAAISGSANGPSQTGSSSQGASLSSASSTNAAIVPVGYVTTAFNNPSQTITTLLISGQPAIIYSKETLPGLSTITAPTTIQTSVIETESDGKTSTFIGGIVVGPGGVFWGPPGLPLIPPFPGIIPPCIWPFCTGGGGGGGSDPPGDPNPPPPYTPDDPNTPDSDPKTQPSDQSTQPSSTQNPSTSSNPSSTQSTSVTSSSASSSCSARVVTDYWVSCASDATTSCSTYSSAAVSGCSASAATSTTASACPLGAAPPPDPTMAGFDYSGEYPILNPGYSSDVQWTYTVAEIVESGVIPVSAAASSAASSSPISSTASASGTISSATPGSAGSSTTLLTTTSPPVASSSNSNGITSSAASTPNSFCQNFADPDQGVAGECQCSSGTFYTTLPLLTGSSDQCGYTSFPSPTPTPAPTQNPTAYPFTYTDLQSGGIIACKSSAVGNAGGIAYTVCEGDSTTVGTDAGIYSYFTQAETSAASASVASVASAVSASSAAAAVPTADCAFWDEALYWTFEVYNINNWAGDNGDSLHHQESGCGDLTGWSWSTGDAGNDQHAYFNLPFFMKAGCVERAIASAGGPSGLSCNGEGVGKKRRTLSQGSTEQDIDKRRFLTDVSSRKRGMAEMQAVRKSKRGTSELQAAQDGKREALSELNPPEIMERAITPAPKRLNARAEFEKLYYLDSRDLVKRGCLDWLWPGKNIPEEWWCNAVLPGVDACTTAIQKKGVVGRFPSMFYTSWGGIGDGTFGVEGTKLWASQNICGRVIDFDGITSPLYQYIVESAVLKPFGKGGLNLGEEEQKQILDPFLKNLSQAFAEQSAGEAYVFVPKGVGFQDSSAWTGWEYPALTRNKQITKIWQVALDTSDPSQFVPPAGKPQGEKTLLWSQGDPPSAIEPKGTRAGTLPSQIPADQVPPNWQSSI